MDNRFRELAGGVLLGLLLGVAAHAQESLPPPVPSPPDSITGPAPVANVALWIGVMSHAAQDTLRLQLGLPKDQGLVISDVVADGPAAKGGIKQHDILLTADGKPLADVPALSNAVTASSGKEMVIELLRAGRKVTVRVTPIPRPAEEPRPVLAPGQDREAIRKWVEQFAPEGQAGDQAQPRAGQQPRRPLRLRFLRPGVDVGDRPNGRALPRDFSISITRDGPGPPTITLRRGGQSFDLPLGELGQGGGGGMAGLMPLVEQLLGGLGGGGDAPPPPEGAEIDAAAPGALPSIDLGEPSEEPGATTPPKLPALPPLPKPIEKPVIPDPAPGADKKQTDADRLEAITRQLEALQKQLKELQAEKTKK